MPARPNDAAAFLALHRDFLILPNAWDAASAKIVELAGAKAIATSSAAVAWAHAYADGNHLPIARLAAIVEDIARATHLPITADCEAGYSDDTAIVSKNVGTLLQAGAVGINLEDGHDSHDLHLRKIEAAREAGVREGVDLFINARTDVYMKKLVAPELALEETIKRGRGINEAGANGLFVPYVMDLRDIAAIAEAVPLPLNVLAWTGTPDAAGLKAAGVRRFSAATGIFNAAMEGARVAAAEFLAQGDAEALWRRRGDQPNYNELFGG